jgi:hypothetical protein
MKTLALLFFTCVLSLALRAADTTSKAPVIFPEIKLSTGEVLKNATLLSQNPTHITLKVGNSMRQVDKRQLPPELQTQYPYDAAAAEARKAALAEAEAKRAADREAKKAAAPAATGPGPAANVNKYVKNGVRISFQSDPEGSGPIITLVNDSAVDQDFAKTEIAAKMIDDRVVLLRVASRGDKLEDGGKVIVVGEILTVRAHDRLEFRGYFLSNPKVNKHNVADVFWAQPKPQ